MSVEVLFDCGEGDVERLRCTPRPDGAYVVEGIPLVACGLSVGDALHAVKSKSGALEADELLEKSGHCTLTAYPPPELEKALETRVKSLGGQQVDAGDGAVAIDLPTEDALVLLEGWLAASEVDHEIADPPDWDPTSELDDEDEAAE